MKNCKSEKHWKCTDLLGDCTDLLGVCSALRGDCSDLLVILTGGRCFIFFKNTMRVGCQNQTRSWWKKHHSEFKNDKAYKMFLKNVKGLL